MQRIMWLNKIWGSSEIFLENQKKQTCLAEDTKGDRDYCFEKQFNISFLFFVFLKSIQ